MTHASILNRRCCESGRVFLRITRIEQPLGHYRKNPGDRFLTPDEFQRLGRALNDATKCRRVSPYSVAAIRLLVLTRGAG